MHPPVSTSRQAPVSPMRLLADGVPLSLLLDLVLGPHSEDLLAEEAGHIPAQRRPGPVTGAPVG